MIGKYEDFKALLFSGIPYMLFSIAFSLVIPTLMSTFELKPIYRVITLLNVLLLTSAYMVCIPLSVKAYRLFLEKNYLRSLALLNVAAMVFILTLNLVLRLD